MSENEARVVNYGLDAPRVVAGFVLAGMVGAGLGVVLMEGARWGAAGWLRFLAGPLLGTGGVFLVTGLVMVWGSKVGKLRRRDGVIGSMPWRGDEVVLDVGCGHGLMLIGAAKRLKGGAGGGRAVGVDLWQQEDQAGNSRAATQRNAEIEGVADRVELKDGDARKLEFAEGTFDVIVSSWALHNIYDEAGRATAVREMVRVLKPGGRMAIVDIRFAREYARVMEECGMEGVVRKGPSFEFAIPTFVVVGRKAGG